MSITRILTLCLLVVGCHKASVVRFDSTYYPPTSEVAVYTDLSTIPKEYVEIGYVEAKGGVTIDKQTLLNDMIEQAKKCGADALVKIEFYDRTYYIANEFGGQSFQKPAAKAVMIKFARNVQK